MKSINEQVNAIAAIKTQRDAIKPVDLPVMRELPEKERRVSHILFKGSYLSPGMKCHRVCWDHSIRGRRERRRIGWGSRNG